MCARKKNTACGEYEYDVFWQSNVENKTRLARFFKIKFIETKRDSFLFRDNQNGKSDVLPSFMKVIFHKLVKKLKVS